MPPQPREKKPYPELGPRWMVQEKPNGIKLNGTQAWRKTFFSPSGQEFSSLSLAKAHLASTNNVADVEGEEKNDYAMSSKELGQGWTVEHKWHKIRQEWNKIYHSPDGQKFYTLASAKAHVASEKKKDTSGASSSTAAELAVSSNTQDEGEVEEKKNDESKESTKRKRDDSDDDTSASTSGASSSTLQVIHNTTIPSFNSPCIPEPMDIDDDDVEQRPKVKRSKVSDSSQSSSTSEVSLSTRHTLQDIGGTILPTFPTSTDLELSGVSPVRSSRRRSNKKSKHQPRDEIDPEERICSHGEDEGEEVSQQERGRKLVSEEHKRIGDKNSRKRRGIGRRGKREIRDQQFKEMGSRQNNAAASTPQASFRRYDASATTAVVASTSARGDIDCGGNDGDKISSVEKKKSVSISEGDSSNDKATTTDSDMEDCQDASGSSSEVSGVAGRVGANPPVADSSTSTATEEMPTVARKPDVGRPMKMLPGGNSSSMSSLSSESASASATFASATSQQGSVVVDSVTQGTVDSLDGSTSGVARGSGSVDMSVEDKSSVAKSSQVNGKDTAGSLPSVRGSEDQSGDGTEVDNSAGSELDESTTSSSTEQFQSLYTQAQSNFNDGETEVALEGFQAALALLPPSVFRTPRGIRCGILCCNGIVHCYIKRGKDLEMEELDYLSELLKKFIVHKNIVCINDGTINSCQLLAFIYKLRLKLQATGLYGTDEEASEMVSTMRSLETIIQGIKESSSATPDITKRCEGYMADAKLSFDTLLNHFDSISDPSQSESSAGGADSEYEQNIKLAMLMNDADNASSEASSSSEQVGTMQVRTIEGMTAVYPREVDQHVGLLDGDDVESMRAGRWLTDHAVFAGLNECVELNCQVDNGIIQKAVDPTAMYDLLHHDLDEERLLTSLGLDGIVPQSPIKVRCFVPVSDGMKQRRVQGTSGSHWSLLILEITKEVDSDQLQIRGLHFNSLKPKRVTRHSRDTQQVVVEMIREKINGLLSTRVAFDSVIEVQDVPQQSDSFSCGDHVIHFARSLAGAPFLSDLHSYSELLCQDYDKSYVVETRTRLKQMLMSKGLQRVLDYKRDYTRANQARTRAKAAAAAEVQEAESTADATTTKRATTSRTSSQASDSLAGLDGFSMADLCAKTNVDGLSDYKGNDVFRKEVKRVFGDKLDKIIQHVENTRGLDGVAIHDGYIECVGDIRRVFFGNYPPSTNLDRVKKRLLWLGPDGLPGEKCWRTMFVTLIDMYVHKYGWEYEVAKNFVMRTTVVINRTPVLMHGSIRRNNKAVYEESVKFTDKLNKEFIQKIIPQMTHPNLHLFMFGEPVYEALNDLLQSIASNSPTGSVTIPQTGKLHHMLQYHICWANRQSFENLHNGFNEACASSQGIKPVPVTSREHNYLSGTKKKGWSMCDLVEEEEREALLKDYNADEKAKEAFQTVEEFALYQAEASDNRASHRVLVWRMEEITDANIQLTWKQTTLTIANGGIIRQATVNDDDVKRQLANIKPLVKCTHKKQAEDSVQLQIGGSNTVIGAINDTSLTQLCGGKFVAIRISTTEWPVYWPLIETDQRGVTLPYESTYHDKQGFTLRKKVVKGGVETWPKVLTSLGKPKTASWVLGCRSTTFSNLSKSTDIMVVSGTSVKYISKDD